MHIEGNTYNTGHLSHLKMTSEDAHSMPQSGVYSTVNISQSLQDSSLSVSLPIKESFKHTYLLQDHCMNNYTFLEARDLQESSFLH